MSPHNKTPELVKSIAKKNYIQFKKVRTCDLDDYMFSLGDIILKDIRDNISFFDSLSIWTSVFKSQEHIINESLGITLLYEINTLINSGLDKEFVYDMKQKEFKNSSVLELIDYIFSKNGLLFSSMTLINTTGDVTLTWEDSQNKKMKEIVQAKLDEGYAFFIMEPRFKFLDFLGKKKVHITDVSQIKSNSVTMETEEDAQKILFQKVKLGDNKAEEAFIGGIVSIANVPENNYSTSKMTKNVDEIIRSHTIATPKIAAG